MASLALSNNLKSPSNNGARLFESLAAYLQPSSTTPAATIADEINQSALSQLGSAEPDIEPFLWEIWKLFITIARQIPPDHPSQDRLVDVVQALGDTRLWTDLPLLGPSMREAWTSPTSVSENPTEEATAAWVSLNAFAARLFTLDSISWPNFAVWTLRSALEEELPGRKLECDVKAAAQWIVRCGSTIFRHTATAIETKSFRGGSLYNGPPCISMERWTFWKQRFGEISASEESLRETCLMATNVMENIEKAG
ncbi:hypothetical protein ATEIFO6365_0009015900 [Aspergillus terreus]|uniref:Uncharacterized protein n=1 Tax=Aspergillus terreus TaxID=33178 RepID=A0A5M3Z7N0_ASPTE|nr:hypothetical protein ATETN484_0011015900 [Aspergillus terreus]GFF18796.1 hypothetical protein ATEIFO6365_0009015900 [Aspergillus terreus]